MSLTARKLDDLVLAAFKEACATGRMEVAEHLLAALEQSSTNEATKGAEFKKQLAQAYAFIARAENKVTRN